MDAFPTDAANLAYSDIPPVLIAGTTDRAIASAERSLSAFGLRIAAALPIGEAEERLRKQVRTAAVWIEIDADCGAAMDDLLGSVVRGVQHGRYGAVVSTSVEMLDCVAARVDHPAVEMVVDGDDADRAAAVAIALNSSVTPNRYSDVASDNSTERLRQLSEEVSRIASTLARLSTGPGAPAQAPPAPAEREVPAISAETIRNVIRARRLRARYFAEDLFADPAWDMMLDLLQAEIAQLRVPVSSLCIAAAVPATTALRWLKTMVAQGVFVRRADPHDGRRVFVELAPDASQSLKRYFAEIGQVPVI